MNKIGSWTFGALVSLLAAGDWAALSLTAEDPREVLPSFTVGDSTLVAEGRDVEIDGVTVHRPVLKLGGNGAGSVHVRLECTRMNPMSRMMPAGKIVWSETIALDGKSAREVVLTACPLPLLPVAIQPGDSELPFGTVDVFSLQVSLDGMDWRQVYTMSVPVQERKLEAAPEEEKP